MGISSSPVGRQRAELCKRLLFADVPPVAAVVCPVPGGSDGPSGVLICSENYITYKNFGDQPDIRCPIPRRRVSAKYGKLRSGCNSDLKWVVLTVFPPSAPSE